MRLGMRIIVILVSIVLFWSGVFYFVSCSDQPEKRAVKVAELALKASVDNAESVRVKGITPCGLMRRVGPVSVTTGVAQKGQALA